MMHSMLERLGFTFCLGAAVGICVTLASEDWRARAQSGEEAQCKDRPDRKAYMARLPGEAHTAERCMEVVLFPRYIPNFRSPLK